MTLDDVRLALGMGELKPRKVLIVEDDLWHLERLTRWLHGEGIEVVGLVAVTALDAEAIVGEEESGASVRAPLAEIGAAFLDYYFPERPFNGGVLARSLSNAGIRCFGMSSVDQKNREMVASGALASLRKRELGALLP